MLSVSKVLRSRKVSTIAIIIGSSTLLSATYQSPQTKPIKVVSSSASKVVGAKSMAVLDASNLPSLLPKTTLTVPVTQRAVVVQVGQSPAVASTTAISVSQPLYAAQLPASVPVPQTTQAQLATTVSLSSHELNTGSAAPISQGSAPTSAEQQDVKSIIASVFPPADVNKAVAIATCESNLNATEVSAPNSNGTRDWGVMQINDGGTLQNLLAESGQSSTNLNQALDPTWNVKAGYTLFTQRGWAPWTCAYKLGIVSKLYTNIPGVNWGM